jgi:hypothetical protein
VRQLTHGPRHHFFGRAGVSPWNGSGTRIACLESAFHGRAPQPGERAQVGVVDPNTGGFSAIATTAAWSFPQGAMIEWSRQSSNDELLFNDMVDGSPTGVRLNVLTGARQVYMRPFVATGGDGARIASVNLGRIARLGTGDGVAGALDRFADETAPEDDGLFILGLTHGLQRLIISIASVAIEARARHADLRRRDFWFDHVSFNASGTRLLFTVSAGGKSARPDGALWTIGIEGEDLREVVPFGRGVSRGAWLDERSCIATFRGDDGILGPRMFTDSDDPGAVLCAGNLTGSVRAIPAPDGSRFAIESENPQRRSKALSILERAMGTATTLVELRMSDEVQFHGPARCDLNPRWNHGGNTLCVDAVGAEGTRQLHVVPVSHEK